VTAEEAASLVAQLRAIDVGLVNELFSATMAAGAADGGAPVAAKLAPCRDVTKLAAAPRETSAAWHSAGLAAIACGKVAALILAGGQGTRLGFDRPKGEYDVRLPGHKCLFQLQVERLRRLKTLAAAYAARSGGGAASSISVAAAASGEEGSVSLPLYVMTSPMTDADTRAFFAEHGNFGLPSSDVMFFSQGTLPCLTPVGKIMLETGWRVAEAPDGNGGIYRALHLSGVIADMKRRGVVGTHVFAVDNAVVRAADPAFLGFCLGAGADVGSKACPKAGPHERVGVLCLRDGAYTVVEYSEMDAATAELRDAATGELAFNAGNICIHYYSTSFLETECSPAALPKVYHMAKKAIPFADPATGRTLTKEALAPLGNTGVKLESFIFDVFPRAKAMAVLEIDRDAEFTPVKNAPGAKDDSPDTARAMIAALHARWLAAAGARVQPAAGAAATGGAASLVEVSPLVSYGGEGLAALAGLTLHTPTLVLAAGEPLPAVYGAGEAGPEAVAPGVTHQAVAARDGSSGGSDAPVHVYRLQPSVEQLQAAL
jgi:UDP-N-acetylglucosamine/UDP-N-acetylgalactosamine diphosphorylase